MARGTGTFDGDALRRLRVNKRVSAAQLAKLVGTSKSMILAYEGGRHIPEPPRVVALADALDLPHPGALMPRHRDMEEHKHLDQIREALGLDSADFRALLDLQSPRRWHKELSAPLLSIATLRRHRGLTAADLAAQTGMGLNTYRRIENEAMLPVRGRAGITSRLAAVLNVHPSVVQTSIDHHPCAIRRQYDVAQLITRLMDRYCGQGKTPAVQSDDPDVIKLASLIRQPLGQVCRIVDYQLTGQQRRLKQRVQTATEFEYPDGRQHEDLLSHRATNLDTAIKQAPYRAASNIAKFLCDGLTSRQWKSFTLVMERLTMAERPEATGVSEQQEPELWAALIGRHHQGMPLTHRSLAITTDTAPAPGYYYFLTAAGFRFYEAARLAYLHLYPWIYAVPAPLRKEQRWRPPA